MPSLETANVGKAVAARVGTNIREVRTKLGMTQAQLAAPEFSISYISAIERGKISTFFEGTFDSGSTPGCPPNLLVGRFSIRCCRGSRCGLLPRRLWP